MEIRVLRVVVYMKQRRGPRTALWGTPHEKVHQDEKA